jgi:hypothetical protein
MKIRNFVRREEGFWSTMVILLLVTLALMGMGSYTVQRSEGPNVAKNINSMQAEYAATGGMYFGLRLLRLGNLGVAENHTYSIGGASTTIDTAWGSFVDPVTSNTYNTRLTVTSQKGLTNSVASRKIEILLNTRMPFNRIASISAGPAVNITTRDSLGVNNPQLCIQNVGMAGVPDFDLIGLKALSTAQGHDQSAWNFKPNDHYPGPPNSFFRSGTTPNVTYCSGNMTVLGGREIYGIFVVEGSIVLDGGCRVEGILWCPNGTNITRISGGGDPTENTVSGGVITKGSYDSHSMNFIQNNMTYMTIFSHYRFGEDSLIIATGAWTYK